MMGIINLAAVNDISTMLSMRALLGGLFVMLIVLPLLAFLKPQKHTQQVLYMVLIGAILLSSSVIFAASLARVLNLHKILVTPDAPPLSKTSFSAVGVAMATPPSEKIAFEPVDGAPEGNEVLLKSSINNEPKFSYSGATE